MQVHPSQGSDSEVEHRESAPPREGVAAQSGRPSPSVRREPGIRRGTAAKRATNTAPPESDLAASFPLIFFGSGLAVVGVYLRSTDSGAYLAHIPLWIPFLLIGLVGLGGGILSVFARPAEVAPRQSDQEPRRTLPGRRELRLHVRRPIRSRAAPSRTLPKADPVPPPENAANLRPPAPPLTPWYRGGAPTTEPARRPTESRGIGADASASLTEIDSIDARLRRSLSGPRAGRLQPSGRPSGPVEPWPSGLGAAPLLGPYAASSGSSPAVASVPSSRGPAPNRRCISCGSAITPQQAAVACSVCQQPICSDCTTQSRAQGRPNLCAFCSVLEELHPPGSATAGTPRER